MEMIPMSLLSIKHVYTGKHCRSCLPFFQSLESTFPAGEGRLAEISLSIYKWKQSVSSESSLFVIT